jgi:3-oxoacyl-[acyl-carrier-protein] synthase III
MNFKFANKRISGILTILPEHEVRFDDEMHNYNFSEAKSLKLKLTMGYNTHRVVEDGVCVSDLCSHGLEYLFSNNLLSKQEIDAIVLVTQSPDYFMPPTSNVIQGRLGLKEDMICMDINQGCAGYIVGLFQAFLLLEQDQINKVVLLNADVLSRKVSKRDRNSNPLIGDAASITVIDKSDIPNEIFGNLKMNGTKYDTLIIPAGGFKTPSTSETGVLVSDAAGNFRSLDHLVMRGDEVFNFVQSEVPPMIEDILKVAGKNREEIDYYMFHQPNKFMLNKLADKLGVPREKMPSNVVENFGNASGVSIPTAISYNLHDLLKENSYLMCLAGFGVGLTWASVLLRLENLKYNEIIYY